jgi:pseudaminic acid cytidylyltransferase
MNIAVIPARGGSKRLPRKNIREFNGVSMLSRAIATAKDTKLFERIFVSTEDSQIARCAREHGAEVPFTRPAQLATDEAGTVQVIAHATRAMYELGCYPRYVCCIYPCTPFLRPEDLKLGLERIMAYGADFVYPVMEYPHPTYRAMRRTAGGKMSFVFPEFEKSRTQEVESTYHDAGQFYWGKSDAWLALKPMHSSGVGLVFPKWRFVDIDTEDDWHQAELLYKALCLEPL